jgi:hypothetical protein
MPDEDRNIKITMPSIISTCIKNLHPALFYVNLPRLIFYGVRVGSAVMAKQTSFHVTGTADIVTGRMHNAG